MKPNKILEYYDGYKNFIMKKLEEINLPCALNILQKLKDDDIDGYKKLVPKKLHNFFYKLKSELVKD